MSEEKKIDKDEKLLRWLHPGQFHWQEKRAISAAFTDKYMSVDAYFLTTLEKSYERAKGYGKNALASIKAQIAYEKKQQICHCPTSVDSKNPKCLVCVYDEKCKNYKQDISDSQLEIINPAHCCVIGKKTSSVKKYFAQNAKVEIYPPNTEK